MIVELPKDYSIMVEDYGKSGWEWNRPSARALRYLSDALLAECCTIINKNKNVNIEARTRRFLFVVENFGIRAVVGVYDPEVRNSFNKKDLGREVAVVIDLPSAYNDFENDHVEWYKETIEAIWDAYKEFKKGKSSIW